MDSSAPELLTLGDLHREIALRCPGVRRHQLTYAIDSYSIEPRQRAGVLRLFGRDQIPSILAALARTTGRGEVAGAP
jgi:hypothetical protein